MKQHSHRRAQRRGIGAVVPTMLAAIALLLAVPQAAHGQFLKKLKDKAKEAAEQESLNQVDRMVRDRVRCVFDDLECIQTAEASGDEYVLTEEDGEILLDDEGNPITDSAQLPPDMQTTAADTPPSMDPNYDFEAGEDVIYAEDFAADNLGDFPRSMTFVRGNWDVVERNGERLLRNTGPRHSAFKIPLPEAIPETFTIEFAVLLPTGNVNLAIATSVPGGGAGGAENRVHFYESNYFDVGSWGVGLASRVAANPTATQDVDALLTSGPVPIRIMADGQYVKVYVGTERVANVPNANLVRSDTLWIENTFDASEERPILIGPIRVAAGGRDLYDVLEAKGRVAVRDILFDTGQATIKPESEAVLTEIGTMLQQHADLTLLIEGHTDTEGGFDMNMQLSSDRAAAVKAYLVETHGVDAERMRTMGLGPTQPVADNETEEGRAQNRRVELVRLGN